MPYNSHSSQQPVVRAGVFTPAAPTVGDVGDCCTGGGKHPRSYNRGGLGTGCCKVGVRSKHGWQNLGDVGGGWQNLGDVGGCLRGGGWVWCGRWGGSLVDGWWVVVGGEGWWVVVVRSVGRGHLITCHH